MKVLHILYQSLPDIAGSTIRSRDIIGSQKSIGLEPVVITSPFQVKKQSNDLVEVIDGVTYYRSNPASHSELANEKGTKKPLTLILKFIRILPMALLIYRIAKKENIEIIHAHSMFFCFFSAKLASLFLKKPVVYEVRSLWEERNKNLRPLLTRVFAQLETMSMRLADAVVTINQGLKMNIIDRGISPKKIILVQNAVNLRLIKNDSITIKKKTPKEFSFGYIGTLSPIEGLDILLKSFKYLRSNGVNNRLIIYGNGIEKDRLKELVEKQNIDEVYFKPPLPHDKIEEAYNEIDIIVNPRTKSPLTDSVTPLKPLEALGYKKLIITSDVQGMKELIEDGISGFMFKADNSSDLARLIQKILNIEKCTIIDIISNGYENVKKNKNWINNAFIYQSLYNKVLDVKK